MALICSLCNEVPEVPVVSPVSGHVFEKRLLEKYLSENGTDPINGEPLAVDMLVELKTAPIVKPKPPSATSIPAILKSLQDEWDAVMLHSFTLRQQLQTARQELSHALYQHDAACRVIARLTKEVTAAREALATLKPQAAAAQAAGLAPLEGGSTPGPATPQATPAMTEAAVAEEVGMSEEVVGRLQEKAALLTAERKRRGKSVPEGLTTAEELRGWRQCASHVGLHSASQPGVLCLDVSPADGRRVLTGGADRNAVVFDTDSEQVLAVLRGHTKKVTSVVYHPTEDLVFSASPDATVRVWGVAAAQCAAVLRAHQGAVTGLSLHATGDFLLSSGADGHWALSDIRAGRVLVKAADKEAAVAVPLTCCQFHPDGLILATGTADAQVKIWDLKERRNVANFASHTGAITALSFSENGYYLATAAEDGHIKLWDLRKLKNFKTLSGPDEVGSLTFDQSGSYLAVAGSDVRIYQCKQWQEIQVFNDHTAAATGVRFGALASSLVTSSMDRSIKVFGR